MKPAKRSQSLFRFVCAATLLSLAATLPAQAATIYVNAASACSSSCGGSWASAYPDLQAALTAAGNGDQIWVAAGTYYPTSGTDRTISFALKNGVSVYGGFAGTETVLGQRDPAVNPTMLSGDIGTGGDTSDNSYHVVVGSNVDATALLDGFTVTAGNGNGSGTDGLGGGMLNNDASPTISNVSFSDNLAGQGGGMYNNRQSTGSSPTLTDVTFANNTASYGGGLYNLINSNATLTNVTFVGNLASPRGGAIYNNNSSPTLTNVTFGSNSAGGGGSAIYVDYGSPVIQDSIFWGSSITVGNLGAANTLSISDSIVQGACPTGGAGTINCSNLVNSDPLLGSLQDNGGFTPTMALGVGSPAIDAGNNATCAATDQRGVTRPQNGTCDMGAFEVQVQSGTGLVVNTAADHDDGACTEIDCTLREAINAANAISGANTIMFAGNYTITLGSQLPNVTTQIDIEGNGAANTIVQASTCNPVTLPGGCTPATYRVFYADTGSDLTLNGLTVANGNFTGTGGGIYVTGASLTVTNSSITANAATGNGGGIFITNTSTVALNNSTLSGNSGGGNEGGAVRVTGSSTLTLTNCMLTGNQITGSSGGGGALFVQTTGNATVTNCVLSSNTADYGGAILSLGTLTVTDSTLSNNSTGTNGGGAIYVQGGTTTVSDSTLDNNTATFGGGIAGVAGEVIVNRSTLSGNSATGSSGGGGIFTQNATVATVINSTIYGNTATASNGGGVRGSSSAITITNSTIFGNSGTGVGGIVASGTGAVITLNNSIVAGSTGGDCGAGSAATVNAQNSLIQDGLSCVNGTNTNNLTGDPLLDALTDNGGLTLTMALKPGSSAIDAGDNTLAVDENSNSLTTDQRGAGHARIVNGMVDMGAYELPDDIFMDGFEALP